MDEDDDAFTDDPVAGLEARLAAVKARAAASIPQRMKELEDALDAHRRGDPGARERIRRLAHQVRGVAEDEGLRALAEKAELAAMDDEPKWSHAVMALVARGLRGTRPPSDPDLLARRPASSKPPVASAGALDPGPGVGCPTTSAGSPGRSKVLVVDDTESLRKLSRLALERIGGHAVSEASSPDEAIALARTTRFDLVLLDAMMPGGSGVDLAERLREIVPDAKLVILSAASAAQLAPNGHVADAWWQKPLPPAALVKQVAALLAAR